MIRCRTLGPVEVTLDGGAPPPEVLWRKNLGLLLYLARSPRLTRTREHLTGLLWGDKQESAARQSLREAIRVLRKVLGEGGLVTEHDQVRLAEGAVRLDTDEFEELERRGDWAAAAALVGGDFLEGFSVPGASPFDDWLTAERVTWQRRSAATLARHADDLLAAGKLDEAIAGAFAALDFEPASDAAARTAMKALALLGDRSAALAAYDRFATTLAELRREPDAETDAVAARVRRERTWRLADSVPTPRTSGAESRRAPLVGREAELAHVLAAWQACVREGRAAAAVIEAEPGLGKTRLAEEVLARARLDGAAVTAVRAVEADRATPDSGILGLARGGLVEAPGLSAAGPAALAAFTARLPEWADRFRPAKASAAAATPPALTSLGAALREVLRVAADEQPLAFGIDDAQWLDHESLIAIAAALRDLKRAPVFVVFGVQSHASPAELDDLRSRLGRDLPGVVVRLGPLDDDAIGHLAAWAVPSYGEAERERLARRIARDSAGLPLLAVELLHAVSLGLDLGTIHRGWPEPMKTLDQTLPGELPDAVVAAIRVGFRRLSAEAQRVLAAAAVLDDREPEERLGRGSGIAGDALRAALDELEWQRWLLAEPRGYGFVARIVRDVVGRDMLTAGQRQRILDAAAG